MKIKHYVTLGAVTLLALASCKNDNDLHSDWRGKYGITFNSTIKGMDISRASGNVWQSGDQVGIYMVNAGAALSTAGKDANRQYVASQDGNLNPRQGEGLYYPATGNVDFYAYYPYNASITEGVYPVNVADQSHLEHIDLLYATKKNVENGNQTVQLQFSHQLSDIVLNFTKDASVNSLEGLSVQLTGMKAQADFQLSTGEFTAKGDATPITMHLNDETTMAEAIVLPTTNVSDVKLSFSLFGRNFEKALSDIQLTNGSKVTALQSGQKLIIPVKISANSGLIAVQVGNSTITDWTEVHAGGIDIDFGDNTGETPSGEVTLIDEPFAESFGVFTVNTISKGSLAADKDLFFIDKKLKLAKASAFVGKDVINAASGRLESALVDLTKATSATLTFSNAINYANGKPAAEILKLQVQKEGETDWTDVTIPAEGLAAGNSWTFKDASVDLSSFKGKKFKIGFLYTSDDKVAPATLQLKNVVLKAMTGENGTVNTPENGGETTNPGAGEMVQIFKVDFSAPGSSKTKIDAYSWNNPGLTFTDPTGNATVRTYKDITGVWMPYKGAEFKIEGIPSDHTSLELSYDLLSNTATPEKASVVKVFVGETEQSIPDVDINNSEYKTVTIQIPAGATSFYFKNEAVTETKKGYRITNIILKGIKQ